jgi:hypothetical protein
MKMSSKQQYWEIVMLFKKIKKWLEKLAEQNDSKFRNQRLDCCNLNRQTRHRKSRITVISKNRKQLNPKSSV